MITLLLLLTLSYSQEIPPDEWVKFDDEEYELETDDGFKLKIKSDSEFELETPDGSSFFTITSSVPIYEVGDITQTKEWGHRDSGYEYLTSDKKIIQDGNYLCIEEDKSIFGIGIAQTTIYHNCVEYPPQYINVSLEELFIDVDGIEHNTTLVNVRNITKINDYFYMITFPEEDYDPTSTGMTTGLVKYLTFDDTETVGANSEDLHNSYNMTITGATTGVGGIIDESYSYDGNDHLSRTAVGTEYDVNQGDFTVNLWYNTQEVSSDEQFFQIWNSAVPNDHIKSRWADQSGTDRILIFTRTTTGDVGYCQRKVESTTDDGDWHMFTMIRNGTLCTDLILYIDNVLQTTVLNAESGENLDIDNMNTLNIGKPNDAQWWFTGEIDEFNYFTRELNRTEISDLYNDGDGWQYPFIITQTPTPTTLLNDSQNNESIYLTWDAQDTAEKFLLHNFSINFVNTTNNYYNNTNLINNTEHCYNITAYNDTYDISESNFSNTICTYTLQNTPLPNNLPTLANLVPANNTLLTAGITLVDLNVTANDDDGGDTVEVSFVNSSNDVVICTNASISPGTTVRCNWAGLMDSVDHNWYVNVTDTKNITTSGIYNFSITNAVPTTPTSLQLCNGTEGDLNDTFTESPICLNCTGSTDVESNTITYVLQKGNESDQVLGNYVSYTASFVTTGDKTDGGYAVSKTNTEDCGQGTCTNTNSWQAGFNDSAVAKTKIEWVFNVSTLDLSSILSLNLSGGGCWAGGVTGLDCDGSDDAEFNPGTSPQFYAYVYNWDTDGWEVLACDGGTHGCIGDGYNITPGGFSGAGAGADYQKYSFYKLLGSPPDYVDESKLIKIRYNVTGDTQGGDFDVIGVYDYSSLEISYNTIYTDVGNHTEGNTYTWNITSEPDETYESMRCCAIDIDGSNTCSDYYTISTATVIDYGVGDSCDYSSGNFVIDCSEDCTVDSATDVGGNDVIISHTDSNPHTIIISSAVTNCGDVTITGNDATNRCNVIVNAQFCGGV